MIEKILFVISGLVIAGLGYCIAVAIARMISSGPRGGFQG